MSAQRAAHPPSTPWMPSAGSARAGTGAEIVIKRAGHDPCSPPRERPAAASHSGREKRQRKRMPTPFRFLRARRRAPRVTQRKSVNRSAKTEEDHELPQAPRGRGPVPVRRHEHGGAVSRARALRRHHVGRGRCDRRRRAGGHAARRGGAGQEDRAGQQVRRHRRDLDQLRQQRARRRLHAALRRREPAVAPGAGRSPISATRSSIPSTCSDAVSPSSS